MRGDDSEGGRGSLELDLHGALAGMACSCDGRVRQALGSQPEDLDLRRAQGGEGVRGRDAIMPGILRVVGQDRPLRIPVHYVSPSITYPRPLRIPTHHNPIVCGSPRLFPWNSVSRNRP